MNRFWATLSSVLLLVTAPGAAGQTRCPIGTQMGSMQCIPDTPEMQGQQAPISEPRGKWTKTWGAIATASSTGEVGTTVGKLSESEARKVAIRQCALGGANDCRINLVYRNQCAALTASQRTGSFFQSAADERTAIDLAMKSCEESSGGLCKIVYSECTKPVFSKN